MPVKSQRQTAEDSLLAGVTASFAMTDVGKSLGSTTPEKVGLMAQRLTAGGGFDQVKSTHGLVLGTLIAIAIFAGVIYLFRDTPAAGIFGLLGMIIGGFALLSIGIALALSMTAYVPVRLRARVYSVTEPDIRAGSQLTAHPLTELFLVIPFKVLALILVAPFWIIGSVFEVLRIVLFGLFSKHISYRGDQGKYYNRVRKQYARVYETQGVVAAKEYLRMAYSGLLTPIGTEIPKESFANDGYKVWLAPMIKRHGPVDKYVKGPAGAPKEVLRSMSNQGTAKVNPKYDAI